jgi:RNA polymerase sigma-70 factor (sigma-E family)
MDRPGVDISALYAANRLSLVRLALFLVDDTASAEDVVQEAFLGLQRNLSMIRDPDAALGYVRRSTINAARSALRGRRNVRSILALAEPESAEPADTAALLAAEHAGVLAAVRQLPRRDQEVLALRYWSELSEAEIADALGVSRGTVKSTASRALAKLTKILEAQR